MLLNKSVTEDTAKYFSGDERWQIQLPDVALS